MIGYRQRPGGQPARHGQRCLVAALAALSMALLTVAGAAAHADLISSEPAAGSTVIGSPATIRLSFSQPLENTSTMQLFTGQFQPVAGLNTVVAGSEMQATLGRPLDPATYTVQWSAATDDGHTTEGSFQFAVAAPGLTAANGLAPLVAAIATILSAGVAIFVWILNRRQRI
jgi:methionine-rich copper-binding protein CopC